MQIENQPLTLKVKWGKNTLEVQTDGAENLESFRAVLYSLTNVLPDKQKLLFKGKFLKDDSKQLFEFKVVDVG